MNFVHKVCEKPRRAGKTAVLVLLSLIVLAALLIGCGRRDGEKSVETFFAMDTQMTLTAYGKGADAVLDEARERILAWEALWSVTEEESDIYRINAVSALEADGAERQDGIEEADEAAPGREAVPVSEETSAILAFALQMARETEGALDPTVYPLLKAWGFTTEEYRIPSAEEIQGLLEYVGYERVKVQDCSVSLEPGTLVDLGAVGKGWAGDLILAFLKEKGIASALLDLGGNIQALGSKPDGSAWRLGLRDPFSQDVYGVVEVRDKAVVTSGAYERYFVGEDGREYGHLLDPATGYPAQSGLASVTVVASEGKRCDALSTALYVMGLEKASAYWREHRDFEMLLVTQDGKLYLTPGIEKVFTPREAGSDWERIVLEP